jgi:hypothetical protein
MKDTDSFRAFTLIMLVAIASGIVFTFNTLSAQSSVIEKRIEQKIERIETQTVPRSEWVQLEKRLEAIHADIREIRNTQQR